MTVHLICGVPGAGKTWVAKQLPEFTYVPHDDYPVNVYHKHLEQAAKDSLKPVLGEAPFRISVLVHQLTSKGISVITYYIDEPDDTVQARYESRMNKPFPKQHQTNLQRYKSRDWHFRGTAEEILEILKKVNS